MKTLFTLFAAALMFTASSAMAASVAVYANPHSEGKHGNGAGASVAVNVTESVDVSLNYLRTRARYGGDEYSDIRIGKGFPVTENLTPVVEVGYGSVRRADADVFPVALGLKYKVAEGFFLVAKGTRYLKNTDPDNRGQFTIGAGLTF